MLAIRFRKLFVLGNVGVVMRGLFRLELGTRRGLGSFSCSSTSLCLLSAPYLERGYPFDGAGPCNQARSRATGLDWMIHLPPIQIRMLDGAYFPLHSTYMLVYLIYIPTHT